jgi:hypothetical protein
MRNRCDEKERLKKEGKKNDLYVCESAYNHCDTRIDLTTTMANPSPANMIAVLRIPLPLLRRGIIESHYGLVCYLFAYSLFSARCPPNTCTNFSLFDFPADLKS